MFDDITQVAEDMICMALSVSKAITPSEIKVREKMARQVLDAWATSAASAQSNLSVDCCANYDSEYDRLKELIVELSLAVPVML